MASFVSRRAFSTATRRWAVNPSTGEQALKKDSKRDPEIMVRDNTFHLRAGYLGPSDLGFTLKKKKTATDIIREPKKSKELRDTRRKRWWEEREEGGKLLAEKS